MGSVTAMIRKTVAAIVYGDALMLLNNQVRPYEIAQGATERVIERCEYNLK